MADSARTYDVVLYGASGFVGRLLAGYLAEHAPADLRIALAGRSAERCAEVRDGLPGTARDWAVLAAEASDAQALDALAAQTRVLVTTVGPYARYGLPVVEACARNGTHYADLTGEVLFVRDAVDRVDTLARNPAPGSCTPAATTPSPRTSPCGCWPSGRARTAPVASPTSGWWRPCGAA